MSGLGKGIVISLLAHGLLFAVVYAVPLDRKTPPDIVSVDFTLLEQADTRGQGTRAGAVSVLAAPSADRKSPVKTAHVPRSGDGVISAEERSQAQQAQQAQMDQAMPQRISIAALPTEGQVSSEEGAPVGGAAGTGKAGSAVGLGSGRSMLGSLDPGWAEASGHGSGDGGSNAALRRIRDEVLKNVIYPERARRMGWEGRVTLSFMIYEDGSVHDARILQSSGVSMLDEAAKEALRKSALKAEVGKRVHVVLPIEYKLR